MIVPKFIRFGIVGTLGFCVDTAVVYALAPSFGLYVAGLLSYLAAATTTWFVNRTWTFSDSAPAPLHRQWALFLAANTVGFVLNRGAYLLLIMALPICRAHPVLAVAAGAVAGLFANFSLSQRVVFR